MKQPSPPRIPGMTTVLLIQAVPFAVIVTAVYLIFATLRQML